MSRAAEEGLAQSLTQTRQAADHITACDGYKPFRYRAESTASTTAWVALEGRPDRWRPLRSMTPAQAVVSRLRLRCSGLRQVG
jgi:hypothetical protein